MLIDEGFIKDVLKTSFPSVEVISIEKFYFDSKTELLNDDYLYLGIINTDNADLTNFQNQVVTVSGSSNPVIFKSFVSVNLTFYGYRIKINQFPSQI
jgi:hypothetical protein